MFIENKAITHKNLTWTLRCPKKADAEKLSTLRVKIDGETEYLDREEGENLLTKDDFEKIIYEDNTSNTSLFLLAEVEGQIVGFLRCAGNTLSRFRHKAEFGICILKDYWGYGIGKILMENMLKCMDTSEVKKINLTVVESNEKAIQMYKQFGFTIEGLLINDRILKDGRYHNTVIMGRFSNN